jgi:hypothetical protein
MPRHTTLAALGAALTAALTACSSSATTASAPAPTTSAASTAASSAPAAPTSAASTASGSGLADWYRSTGKDLFASFDTEAAQLHTDGQQALSADSSDCSEIDSTQTAAAAAPAPPDPSIAAGWKAALDQIHQGTYDCNGGKAVGLTELGTGLTLMDTVRDETRSKTGA